jgi:hypothetical protein
MPRRLRELTTTDEYLSSDYDIAKCSYKLLHSVLFGAHKDYVRRQIVYCLLQVWNPLD